ncbi:GGDEF domain-containing protein [Starkeya koreensis]|uniref:diguanylate cyclase n=1 Tax=Ancylobacter koreensis TaxID=266121 RepID=A0ABT0DQ58_9HYPH|nr:GGDEF domain-containing protein [Ancylobacter koreensis]MCK0209403.1 GGDEF domain-containing protein [Ancylobacter koreensis]
MSFDPLTIWSVVLLIGLMLSAVMVLAWTVTPDEPALLYWAAFCAILVTGIAGIMARGVIPDFVSISLANALVLLGYGLIWVGLRVFDRRRPRLGYTLIAPALWIVLCELPLFRDHIASRIVLGSSFMVVLVLLAFVQLWRGWVAPSKVRPVAAALLGISITMSLLRIPFAGSFVEGDSLRLMSDPRYLWMGLLAISLLILVGFTLVMLVRERTEQTYRTAAQRDPLTGLLNRRGFHAEAVPLCRRGGALALMLLDLDRFKQVNDRFGHAAGDRVLMAFGEALMLDMPGTGILARIGGEEFAVLLPGLRMPAARLAAERIQRNFAEGLERLPTPGLPIHCTVSIGLASGELTPCHTDTHAEAALHQMLKRADAALYRAKSAGRDRIEIVVLRAEDFRA